MSPVLPLALVLAVALAKYDSFISGYALGMEEYMGNVDKHGPFSWKATYNTSAQPYSNALPPYGLVRNSLGFLPLTKLGRTVFAYDNNYYAVEVVGVTEFDTLSTKRSAEQRRPFKSGEVGYCALCPKTDVSLHTTNYQDFKKLDWAGMTTMDIENYNDGTLGFGTANGRNVIQEGFTSPVHNNKTLRYCVSTVYTWPSNGPLSLTNSPPNPWTVSWTDVVFFNPIQTTPYTDAGVRISFRKLTGATLQQSTPLKLKWYHGQANNVAYITLGKNDEYALAVKIGRYGWTQWSPSANGLMIIVNDNDIVLPVVPNTDHSQFGHDYLWSTEFSVIFGPTSSSVLW